MQTVAPQHTATRTPAMQWTLVSAAVAAVCLLTVALREVGERISPSVDAYVPWDASVSLSEFTTWFLSGLTEPAFYTCGSAGLGLLVGGAVAHGLALRNSRWQGFGQACGSGQWPWVVGSALTGLLVSNLVWAWTLDASGTWQPLFVPFVSISPTVVLLFGPSVRNVLTGALLGAVVVTPAALIGVNYVCDPLDLAPVIGVTGGMAVGSWLSFAICRAMPWMAAPLHLRQQELPRPVSVVERTEVDHGLVWTLRRALADFSEAQFFGNEWASAGLIAGALVAYLLNPALPAYGSGLLPHIVAAQVITAAAGVLFWHRAWAARPFHPTFVPVVSVAPAVVLTFGGTWQAVVVGALLGAVVAPFVAATISSRLPEDFHPFIGNVASMAISTALLIEVLKLMPGFDA